LAFALAVAPHGGRRDAPRRPWPAAGDRHVLIGLSLCGRPHRTPLDPHEGASTASAVPPHTPQPARVAYLPEPHEPPCGPTRDRALGLLHWFSHCESTVKTSGLLQTNYPPLFASSRTVFSTVLTCTSHTEQKSRALQRHGWVGALTPTEMRTLPHTFQAARNAVKRSIDRADLHVLLCASRTASHVVG
jgi:hypothetical protein